MQIGGVGGGYSLGMMRSGFAAISKGQEQADQAAQNIANGSILSSDMGVEDVVSLKEAEVQTQAGAKVLDVYNKTIGSIIDIEVQFVMNIVATYPNIPALNLNVPTEAAQHDAAARQIVPATNQTSTNSNENEVGSQREKERNTETKYYASEGASDSDVENSTYSSIVHSRGGNSKRDENSGDNSSSDTEQDQSQQEKNSSAKAQQNDKKISGELLTDEEQAKVDSMKARDKEVRVHEQRHKAVGGQYAAQPSYTMERGPDGHSYVVDGEVSISVSEESTPEKTVAKMKQVYAAALAPAEPSSEDRKVAAEAKNIQHEAEAKIRKEKNSDSEPQKKTEDSSVSEDNKSSNIGKDVSLLMEKRNRTIASRYSNAWTPFRTSVSAFA